MPNKLHYRLPLELELAILDSRCSSALRSTTCTTAPPLSSTSPLIVHRSSTAWAQEHALRLFAALPGWRYLVPACVSCPARGAQRSLALNRLISFFLLVCRRRAPVAHIAECLSALQQLGAAVARHQPLLGADGLASTDCPSLGPEVRKQTENKALLPPLLTSAKLNQASLQVIIKGLLPFLAFAHLSGRCFSLLLTYISRQGDPRLLHEVRKSSNFLFLSLFSHQTRPARPRPPSNQLLIGISLATQTQQNVLFPSRLFR